MKNIIAIIIIISSLVLLINKRLSLFSSWGKVEGEIIGLNKINKKRLDYKYKINNEIYDGYLINDKDKLNVLLKNKKINIYYHKINPELSIEKIPVNLEDYLLFIISITGGLYLYLFSCDSYCKV